jgi:hypothetical protein
LTADAIVTVHLAASAALLIVDAMSPTDTSTRSEFDVVDSRLVMRAVVLVTDSVDAATFTCLVAVADAR